MSVAENQRLADRLREKAILLEQQGANPFRIAAYRRAADTLIELKEPARELADRNGPEGLTALFGIGPAIAAAIIEMLGTGRWAQLERLRGELEPDKLFQAIPGVGPRLAHDFHEVLHVDTLEALEAAAHDGRLEAVHGVGPRRAAMLRGALTEMLSRRMTLPRLARTGDEPNVETLLDVDREYREGAQTNTLPKIAPRRLNPSGEAWLPVLHTHCGDWHFTALFSNTARAHELGRTNDWVVIYFQRDDRPEGQRTVVTETRGMMVGQRVVRGREAECQAAVNEIEA